jgi:hypothetical protein
MQGLASICQMLNWWMTLDFKGRLRFWCILGLLLNGALYFVGLWMPKVLIACFLILMLTFLTKGDSAADI